MCGIAGYFGRDPSDRTVRMTAALAHRGPDDEGTWTSRCHPIALGNRRLKIIDLSAAGHQPMVSEDGRFVLTFNGEIYNYLELRDVLAARGRRCRSKSDTEVFLQA